MFECERCCRIFTRKYHLERHLNKKTPCKPEKNDIKKYLSDYDSPEEPPQLELTCQYCQVTFSRKQRLTSHLENPRLGCFHKKILKEELSRMKLTTVVNQTVNHVKNINNVNNVNNVNIYILPQGKERIDHIKEEQLLSILNQEYSVVIHELMRLIYFNKDVPENNNWGILYPNNEYGALHYNIDTNVIERWLTSQIVDKNYENMLELILPLMDKISAVTNLNQEQRRNITRFYHDFGSDYVSKVSPEKFNNVKMVAYNNRHIPFETWKKLGLNGDYKNIKL